MAKYVDAADFLVEAARRFDFLVVGERNPRANLICLYVEAGLGPAQEIREVARSAKLLGPVLESQALALRALLPELRGPRAVDLLLGCHGT